MKISRGKIFGGTQSTWKEFPVHIGPEAIAHNDLEFMARSADRCG